MRTLDLAELKERLDELEAMDREEPDGEEIEELSRLTELFASVSEDDGPFIHEADFEDYARELAENIGAINGSKNWPCNCIDWERAADELKMDYSVLEYDGETYLYR